MEQNDWSSFSFGQLCKRANLEADRADQFENLYNNLLEDHQVAWKIIRTMESTIEHEKQKAVDNYVAENVIGVQCRNRD